MVGSLTETGSLIIRKGISPAIPGHCDNEETRVSRTSRTTHGAGARTPTTNGGTPNIKSAAGQSGTKSNDDAGHLQAKWTKVSLKMKKSALGPSLRRQAAVSQTSSLPRQEVRPHTNKSTKTAATRRRRSSAPE